MRDNATGAVAHYSIPKEGYPMLRRRRIVFARRSTWYYGGGGLFLLALLTCLGLFLCRAVWFIR